MKFALLFLVFGAALAVPQNFYWSFSAKPAEQENAYRYLKPVPKSRYNWLPYGGYPFDQDDHLVDGLQDDDGQLQRLPYGIYARQGLLSNFFPQFASVATLYSYTATVTVSTTVTATTTCIPTKSFASEAANGYSTTPCAARRRREIWNVPGLQESISPSNVGEVVSTAVPDFSFIEQARNLDIASSLETEPESGSRQKRLFGIFRPLTTVIKTDFKSVVVTQTNTTLTEKRFQSLGCLPAGLVVCKGND